MERLHRYYWRKWGLVTSYLTFTMGLAPSASWPRTWPVRCTVATPAQTEAALSAAATLSGRTWPGRLARLNRLLAECRLQTPTAAVGWAKLIGLLNSVKAIGAVFEQPVYQLPLSELAAKPAPAGRKGMSAALVVVAHGSY